MIDPDVSLQINSFYDYIADNFANKLAAENLKHTIKTKLTSISTMPKSGTSILAFSSTILEEFQDIRKLTAKKYIILYEYYEDVDLAYISHLFHQTQNYGKIFQK